MRSLPTGPGPCQAVEVDGGANFVVLTTLNNTLCKVSAASGAVIGSRFDGVGPEFNAHFDYPIALAMGPRGGSDGGVELVVLDLGTQYFKVFSA